MTEHSRSLSELTGKAEPRATQAGLSEVELSELRAVTGGATLAEPGDGAPWCGTKPRLPVPTPIPHPNLS